MTTTCQRCGKTTDMPFHTCAGVFPTDEQLNLAMCEWMGWTGVTNQWWCPTCRKGVIGDYVTYDERHDERAGGCGQRVMSEEPEPDYLSPDSPRRLLDEAEARLDDSQIDEYRCRLRVWTTDKERISQCATARQRVVALLQTVKPELFQ